MSKLTESEYEEYIQLLRVWVDAERALDSPVTPDSEAQERARTTRAAVQGFRQRYGLGGQERALEPQPMAEGKR